MLKKLLSLLVVAASCAVVPPASHADQVFAFVVRGSRSGYVDVKLDWFDLDPHRAQMRSRKGHIAGFWAERRGTTWAPTSDHFGYLQVGTADPVATAMLERRKDVTVKTELGYGAGTYRFHIVADGPFELVVPVDSGLTRSMLITPKKFVAAPRLLAGRPSATGSTVWDAREKVVIGTARTAVLSASVAAWNGPGTHYDVQCFAKTGTECVPTDPFVDMQGGVSTVDGQHGSGKLFAGPGSLAPGAWDVVQRGAVAPGTNFSSIRAYALVFRTP